MTFRSIVAFWVCLLVACFSATQKVDFKTEFEQGHEYFVKGQLNESAKSFQAALKAAEDDNWIMGKIMARRQLALIEIARGNYQPAVDGLNNAILLCEIDATCSSDDVDILYGYIGIVYLSKAKDLEKARGLVDKIQATVEKKGIKDKSSICKYLGFLERSKEITDISEIKAQRSCP